MWSWYYGNKNPKNIFSGQKRLQQRSNSISSIDLTEALNPDWYFRERNESDPRGILKSPGQIKQVGFGKNKVAFLDILGLENVEGRQL